MAYFWCDLLARKFPLSLWWKGQQQPKLRGNLIKKLLNLARLDKDMTKTTLARMFTVLKTNSLCRLNSYSEIEFFSYFLFQLKNFIANTENCTLRLLGLKLGKYFFSAIYLTLPEVNVRIPHQHVYLLTVLYWGTQQKFRLSRESSLYWETSAAKSLVFIRAYSYIRVFEEKYSYFARIFVIYSYFLVQT